MFGNGALANFSRHHGDKRQKGQPNHSEDELLLACYRRAVQSIFTGNISLIIDIF